MVVHDDVDAVRMNCANPLDQVKRRVPSLISVVDEFQTFLGADESRRWGLKIARAPAGAGNQPVLLKIARAPAGAGNQPVLLIFGRKCYIY